MKILGKVSTIFSLWLWFILQKWLLMKMSIDLLQEQSNSSTLWPVISITKFSLINIVVKRSYKICRKMMQLIHSTLLLEICASNLQHESSYQRKSTLIIKMKFLIVILCLEFVLFHSIDYLRGWYLVDFELSL